MLLPPQGARRKTDADSVPRALWHLIKDDEANAAFRGLHKTRDAVV